MDKMFSSEAKAVDGPLCMASIAGVYSPLILFLVASFVLF